MPRKLDRRIARLMDERHIGNGWFVELKDGFAFRDANTSLAQHDFGEDTLADVRRSMKDVVPCACVHCVRRLAAAPTT